MNLKGKLSEDLSNGIFGYECKEGFLCFTHARIRFEATKENHRTSYKPKGTKCIDCLKEEKEQDALQNS